MIICTKCSHHNVDDAEFCGGCGEFLEWTGQKLEAPADADAKEIAGAVADAPDGAPPPAGSAPAPLVESAVTPSRPEPAAPGVTPLMSGASAADQGAAEQAPERAAREAATAVTEPPAPQPGPEPPPPAVAEPKTPPPVQPAAVLPARPAPRRPEPPTPAAEEKTPPLRPGESPCPSCGIGNEPGRTFCRRCGASLAPPPPEEKQPGWLRKLLTREPKKPPAAGERPMRAKKGKFKP